MPIQGSRAISAWVKTANDGRVVSTGMTSQGKAFNLVIADGIVGVMGQSFDFYPLWARTLVTTNGIILSHPQGFKHLR